MILTAENTEGGLTFKSETVGGVNKGNKTLLFFTFKNSGSSE